MEQKIMSLVLQQITSLQVGLAARRRWSDEKAPGQPNNLLGIDYNSLVAIKAQNLNRRVKVCDGNGFGHSMTVIMTLFNNSSNYN